MSTKNSFWTFSCPLKWWSAISLGEYKEFSAQSSLETYIIVQLYNLGEHPSFFLYFLSFRNNSSPKWWHVTWQNHSPHSSHKFRTCLFLPAMNGERNFLESPRWENIWAMRCEIFCHTLHINIFKNHSFLTWQAYAISFVRAIYVTDSLW